MWTVKKLAASLVKVTLINITVINLKINFQANHLVPEGARHLPRATPLCLRQVGCVGPCSTTPTTAEQGAWDVHFGWLTLDETFSSETGHLKEPLLLSPILHRCFLQSCLTTSLPPCLPLPSTTVTAECPSCEIKHERWTDLMESLTYLQDMLFAWDPSFGHSHLLCHYFRQRLFWQGTGRIAPGGRWVVFVW